MQAHRRVSTRRLSQHRGARSMHRPGLLTEPKSEDIYLQTRVPINSCEIFDNEVTARAVACGDLRLVHDNRTGLISNAAFDSSTQCFSDRYNGSQHGSAHFGRYAADLSSRLAQKHDLRGKHVVEIGCGDGSFLKGLCEVSGAIGTGIDPSLVQEGNMERPGNTEDTLCFLPEFLGTQHYGLEPDLIICRHTLEHTFQLDEILHHVSRLMQGRTDIPFYLDVPDTSRIADEGAFWDIYYEHCHYFTSESLQNVLAQNGFRTHDIHTEFDDQYVCATAYLGNVNSSSDFFVGTARNSQEMEELAARLSTGLEKQLQQWRNWFADKSPGTVMLWGSGSKAVAFLTSLGLESQVAGVVDINPDKQNSFLAGSGHRVVSTFELVDLAPEFIIIMNPAYVSEIKDALAELSVHADIRVLGFPHPENNSGLCA